MNELPTIIGTTGVSEAFPFRKYVYNGTEPFTPPKPRPDAPKCTADDCTSTLYARGLCSKHYRRLIAHGTTDVPDMRRKENRPDAPPRQNAQAQAPELEADERASGVRGRWNACRRCHNATHELQDATAELRDLVRRADRGANLTAQIAAKQDEARLLRLEIDAHQDVGLDSPHLFRADIRRTA